MKCKFCKRKRKGESSVTDDDWVSDIAIVDHQHGKIIDVMTVCPKCRAKHTISELYDY